MAVGTKEALNLTNKRDPELTRRRLLKAGTKLFAVKGRDGTSVDEICQASGVNCRMIYHYFGSKDALYMAVLEEVYGRIRELVVKSEPKPPSIAEYIDNLTERYFRFLQANPEFVSILRWENASGAEGIRQLDLDNFRGLYFEEASSVLGEEAGKQVTAEKSLMIILSCCSLCGYYFSNKASLSHVFGTELNDKDFAEQWLTHIKQVLLTYYAD
ncbi:MAG: TetR/AcrR family transcriptional regulator [Planctomycetales bacterium]|nr:TetR/AcrR family transcriptional regulator [Planctomycetales bacterium]